MNEWMNEWMNERTTNERMNERTSERDEDESDNSALKTQDTKIKSFSNNINYHNMEYGV